MTARAPSIPAPSPSPAPGVSPRRRRKRIVRAVVLVGLVAVAVFHVPILRGIGRLMIVDTAGPQPDALLLMSGDGMYSQAAKAALANPDLIVLKPEYTKARLEQMGIWPDRIAEFHRELNRRGVPEKQLVVLAGEAANEWQVIERLDRWLAPDAQQQITALCEEFQTRRLKTIVDAVMKSRARQVGIQPLTDRRFDSTNWWKSRGGIRAVVLGSVSLVIASLHQGSVAAPPPWDPDVYEQALRDGTASAAQTAKPSSWKASIARWLDIGETPRKVDHVVLLPGDENVRPFVAAAIVKAGLARDILLPQNHASPAIADGMIVSNHEATALVLSQRGVAPDQLRVLSMKSDGTIEDAIAAKEVLDLEPDATVAVVTSFYHTRRARMAFRAVFDSRADSFLYVSAPVDEFDADTWWQSEHGAQMIASELVKVVIYWVSYGPGAYWLAAALVVAILLLRWRRVVKKRRTQELNSQTQSASPQGAALPGAGAAI